MDREVEEFETILDRCARVLLENPAAGLPVAGEGIAYAEQLGNLFMSRALANQATALKANGIYLESEEKFNEALTRLGDDRKFDRYKGDILRRMVYLKLDQRQLEIALPLAEQAAELYRTGNASTNDHGKALLSKAIVLLEMDRARESVPIFEECLRMVSSDDISYYVALHNLAHAIISTHGFGAEDLSSVLQFLDQARKRLPRGSVLPRIKLKWVEAVAMAKCGINNRALKLMKEIRRELVKLNASPVEIAVASIDIAQIHINDGDIESCLKALSRAQRLLEKSENISPEAPEAVERCIEVLRENGLHLSIVVETRAIVLRPPQRLSAPTHPC